MKQAGFEDQEFIGTSDFKSSPVTTGALFLVRKRLEENDLDSIHERKPSEIYVLSGKGTPAERADGST
jgi:hypothetical protein